MKFTGKEIGFKENLRGEKIIWWLPTKLWI